MEKRYLEVANVNFKNMGLRMLPTFKYDETTANVDLITDFIKYVRTRYSILFGYLENDNNRYVCANWWFNRFVCTRSGRPMRLPASYIAKEYKEGVTDRDYAEKRVLEQLSSYPSISDRTHPKLDYGIIFKGFEGKVDPVYMAANPSDIDGIRTNYICLDMMPKSLAESYKSVCSKRNWDKVEDMMVALQKKYPNFTYFKAGMNVIEQALAHIDSAGYYIASILDKNRDRISGAEYGLNDYKCSFDYREKLEKAYGKEKVSHYFDDILISRKHAQEIKMCYFA